MSQPSGRSIGAAQRVRCPDRRRSPPPATAAAAVDRSTRHFANSAAGAAKKLSFNVVFATINFWRLHVLGIFLPLKEKLQIWRARFSTFRSCAFVTRS